MKHIKVIPSINWRQIIYTIISHQNITTKGRNIKGRTNTLLTNKTKQNDKIKSSIGRSVLHTQSTVAEVWVSQTFSMYRNTKTMVPSEWNNYNKKRDRYRCWNLYQLLETHHWHICPACSCNIIGNRPVHISTSRHNRNPRMALGA